MLAQVPVTMTIARVRFKSLSHRRTTIAATRTLVVNGTSRHFAAAQKFGRFWIEADITAGFMSTRPNQPSLILPNNPALQFNPPPSFSNTGESQNGDGGGKPGEVDCIVRFAPEMESDVARKANEAFSTLAYNAPAPENAPGIVGPTLQNTAQAMSGFASP